MKKMLNAVGACFLFLSLSFISVNANVNDSIPMSSEEFNKINSNMDEIMPMSLGGTFYHNVYTTSTTNYLIFKGTVYYDNMKAVSASNLIVTEFYDGYHASAKIKSQSHTVNYKTGATYTVVVSYYNRGAYDNPFDKNVTYKFTMNPGPSSD